MQAGNSGGARGCAVLAMAALLQGVVGAEERPSVSGEHLNRVDPGLETVHTEWLKPYAKGTIRPLIICSNNPYGPSARSVVELYQRLSIDYTEFTVDGPAGTIKYSGLLGGENYYVATRDVSHREKKEELLEKLTEDYDCYIFAGVKFSILPAEAQYKILRSIADGAGLLITGVESADGLEESLKNPIEGAGEKISKNVPFSGLSYFSKPETNPYCLSGIPEPFIEGYQLGKGRIAWIKFPPHEAGLRGKQVYFHHWQTELDYMIMLAANALLWSVPDKSPTVVIESLPEDGLRVPRHELPKELPPVVVAVGGGAPAAPEACVRIRDVRNEIEFEKNFSLDVVAGRASVVLALPVLAKGRHFLDVIVSSERGKEAWASSCLHVVSDITIEEITLERDSYEKGETVTGKVVLAEPAGENVPLLVYVKDSHGRLWMKRTAEVKKGEKEGAFSLPLEHPRAIVSYVVVEVLPREAGMPPLDRAEKEFLVPRRQLREFPALMWIIADTMEMEADLLNSQLRKAAFNMVHFWEPGPYYMGALNEMVASVYATRINLSWQGGLGKCFWDQEERKKQIESTLKKVRASKKYGPFIYSLGDENNYSYSHGYRDDEKAEFRKYLKETYGCLENLNREWEADFESWKEVAPFPVEEAREKRKTAARHDHMAFIEKCYADCHTILARAIREVDDRGLVGAEGSDAGDLELTIEELDFWGPYRHRVGQELLRSLAPEFLRGSWWGGYTEMRERGPILFWRQLLSGQVNMSLFFTSQGDMGLLSPSLTYASCLEETVRDLGEIAGGLGQLLSAMRLDDQSIAILHSQVSRHLADVYSPFGNPEAGQLSLILEMDRLGIGYRFVTDRQVAKGVLEKDRIKLLFMPVGAALSEATVSALRSFVEGGGVVIADAVPAIANDHARLLPEGQLDALFGLRRKGGIKVTSMIPRWKWDIGGAKRAFQGNAEVKVDDSILLAGGARRTKGELFTRSTSEKGTAMLLGAPFSELLPSLSEKQREFFFEDLLTCVAASRRVRWQEGPLPELIRVFKREGMSVLCLILPQNRKDESVLKLDATAHVYDLRAGHYLGRTDRVATTPTDQGIRMLVLFGKRQQQPEVRLARDNLKPGEVLPVKVTVPGGVGGPSRIVRMEVYGPDGDEMLPYRDYLSPGKDDAFEYILPLAFNDPPGRWRIIACDVATGLKTRQHFNVR